jgi:hypothetical protein
MSDTSSETTDSFTETKQVSWLQRIKDALVGILIGIGLVLIACFLLFWNEGRAVQTARSLTEGRGAVASIDPQRTDPANEGKIVHLAGAVKIPSSLTDEEFGVSAQALRLVRKVEMYQWREEKKTETRKNFGGSEETVTTYSYQRAWLDTRQDSSRFRNQDGHRNPDMRYHARDLMSRDATLGTFQLNETVLRQIAAGDELRVDPALAGPLQTKLSGPVQVTDGRIYLGRDPGSAQIGDHRIGYRVARPESISVIGRQSGSGFAEYQTQAGDRLLMATAGNVPAADMFRAAERENTIITWAIRIGGAFAIFLGWVLVFRPLSVVGDLVPLVGTILSVGTGLVAMFLTFLIAPTVIGIAWLFYRPLIGIAILLAGLGGAIGIKMLASRRAASAGMAPARA